MAQIEASREIGFCFGVKRAISMLEEAAQEYGGVETLGAVVHNQTVVDRLATLGVEVRERLDQLRGNVVAISSHGIAPQIWEEIQERQLKLVDTTCPRVKSAQRAARKLAESKFDVIIFGNSQHPEVRGVLGWAGERGIATLDERVITNQDHMPHRLGIVSQTTQSQGDFAGFICRIIDIALPSAIELRIINTICEATQKRQTAALELAQRCDLMFVVGGYTSANTHHLVETCSTTGVETHLIESSMEIDPSWIEGHSHIGVTAGTSTPDEAVAEVILELGHLTEKLT